MATIGTYQYTYGAGQTPNREIEFRRSPGGTVTAYSWALSAMPPHARVGHELAAIHASQIPVEMNSTTEKVRFATRPEALRPDTTLHAMTKDQQDALMHSLQPGQGTWKLEIRNALPSTGAASITIFNAG